MNIRPSVTYLHGLFLTGPNVSVVIKGQVLAKRAAREGPDANAGGAAPQPCPLFPSQEQLDGALSAGTGALPQDQACPHANWIALLIVSMLA